jgi:two-component system, cell cycle sensor histidine kinase and response regulator CckA
MPVPAPTTAMRILVVDDELSLHSILKSLLEHRGAGVHLAGSGDEAIVMFDAASRTGDPYHVVITDLALGPGMDGHELARRIRSRGGNQRILACTGSSAHPIVDKPAAFGFDGCVTKPFLLHDLLDAVMGRAIDG